MTTDEKRIKIAEACGWVLQPHTVLGLPVWRKGEITTPEGWLDHWLHDLPDYFVDLNACHEAEKVIRKPCGDVSDSMAEDRMYRYAEFLNFAIDAPAAQRAEAFGLTLGLWEAGE